MWLATLVLTIKSLVVEIAEKDGGSFNDVAAAPVFMYPCASVVSRGRKSLGLVTPSATRYNQAPALVGTSLKPVRRLPARTWIRVEKAGSLRHRGSGYR